jgi:hypothetical protein
MWKAKKIKFDKPHIFVQPAPAPIKWKHNLFNDLDIDYSDLLTRSWFCPFEL